MISVMRYVAVIIPAAFTAEPPDRRHRCVVGICLHGERDCGGGVCVVPQGVEERRKAVVHSRAIRTRGRSPRAIRKIASSRLSAATQLPFAHEMALPSSICKSTAFYASVKQHSRNRWVN